MTTLTKAIKSLLRNDCMLKSASSNAKHHYTSLQDYVYHIKNGNFEGVHPSVLDTCPVCTAVYKDMSSTRPEPATITTTEPLNEINPQFWIALWIMYHDSAAYEDNYYDDQYA